MRILFLGQNPAKKLKDPKVAFIGSKSGIRLMYWIAAAKIDILECDFKNAFDHDGPYDKSSWGAAATYLSLENPDAIVACGNVAYRLAELVFQDRIPILKIEHPSGLNRNLNDPNKVQKTVDDLKRFYSELKRGTNANKLRTISKNVGSLRLVPKG